MDFKSQKNMFKEVKQVWFCCLEGINLGKFVPYTNVLIFSSTSQAAWWMEQWELKSNIFAEDLKLGKDE